MLYSLSKNPVNRITAINLEALKDDSLVKGGPGRASNGNIALTDFKVSVNGQTVKLINPRATFEQKNLPISAAIDSDPKSAWALDPQFGKNHSAIFEFSKNSNSKNGDLLEFKIHFNNNHKHNITDYGFQYLIKSLPLYRLIIKIRGHIK